MRELTATELHTIYEDEACPFCADSIANFILGPRGGMSQNVECRDCGAKLNILAPDQWRCWPTARIGQLIEPPEQKK